jgi:SAM-dependent methyltransferase
LPDFTGERLVPGEVDADLWNEHISRYFFAASLAKDGHRVLDAGCGTGYGAGLLHRRSRVTVLGIDLSPDAITHATREYGAPGAQFAIGRCETLPLPDAVIDVITAFEVIEHLDGWREFLLESRRVLTGDGLLLVSTPNRAVYAESRGDSGPNPFHVHEFDFNEFSRELSAVFPFVRIYGQNHTGTITLTALGEIGTVAERESLHFAPDSSGYLLAVCSQAELPAIPNFVFVPEAANTLLERDRHIRLLTEEVAVLNEQFTRLLERHRAQFAELERSNRWAASLDEQLQSTEARILELQAELARSNAWAELLDRQLLDSGNRVVGLQSELARSNAWAEDLNARVSADESRILELQAEVESKNEWAAALSRESDQRGARVVALQEELEERTAWALSLDARLKEFESSRWVRLGKSIRVGPLAQ